MKYYVILVLMLSGLAFSCRNREAADPESLISLNLKNDTVIVHGNIASAYVAGRQVEVWLPAGYNSREEKAYPVLYMHDGQNVFNPATSYSGTDWGVDEAADSLIASGLVEPFIVVAVWNNGQKRLVEYLPDPQDPVTSTPEAKDFFMNTAGTDQLLSDAYLQFLVEELKPFVQKHYRVSARKEDTGVMGSSMGGLISLYALCSYPEVFGSAACLSTHWPVSEEYARVFVPKLEKMLPEPAGHRIYFDYGTETLDALYEPWQLRVDSIMVKRGYTRGDNWVSLKFEGADHSESAWRKRVHIPLEFLFRK